MAGNGRKKPANGTVIAQALEAGLQQASRTDLDFEVRLLLNKAQRNMVLELCNVLGLSARSLLNAALRYALHRAERSEKQVTEFAEFPRRLSGEEVLFELTAETFAKAREADLHDVARGTVTGIKLLHASVLEINQGP
jgi:hypothetical protein